jgi:hypothetical protein
VPIDTCQTHILSRSCHGARPLAQVRMSAGGHHEAGPGDCVADSDKAAGGPGRGTAAASIGPHARVDPGARRRPWRLHGFPAHNGPRRNPSEGCGQARSNTGAPDGVVSLARCAPRVHAPWAWRMTRPLCREARQAPASGSAQAPQHGWASRSRATHLRCLEAWRPVAAGRNARRQ